MKHVFATALLLASAIGLSGCNGIPSPFNDNPSNTGFNTSNPSSWPAIQAEINAAATQAPSQIKQGEFVHYVQNYVFEDQVSELVSETSQTVTNRDEEPPDVIYTIAQDMVTYSGGVANTVSTEFTETAALPSSGSPAPTPMPTPTPVPNATPAPATPLPLEYYNFVKTVTTQDPPAAVKAAADCGGLNPCQMRVVSLSWDQIDRNDHPEGDRTHVQFQISPDVPYLAGILSQCITGLLPIEGGTHLLVQQCDNAVDFRFGHD